MALPDKYTEASLKAYMHAALGPIAGVLGWSVDEGNYDEPLNDTLLAYGVSDVEQVTGAEQLKRLRALARYQVWKAAVSGLAALYDFETDGQRFERSQLMRHAEQALALAESEALPYLAEYSIGVIRVEHPHDPYQYYPLEERTRR